MQNYQSDFSGNGGWGTWNRLLEPQNNYYGALFGSLDEANAQRGIEQSGDINEALAGSGYTSIRGACQDQLAGTGNTGPSQPSQARCAFMGKIFTPADLLGKATASTIDNDLGWLVSSDELSEVIIAIGAALTNRMANLAISNPSNDYKTAPEADTSNSSGYLACINSCPAGRDLSCQNNCAKAWGYNVPSASCSGADCIGGGIEVQVACTATGPAEQAFMLPLLNGGTSPQDVVSQTNQKFGLTTGNEAVYYPNNNTIGLPEFYLAGPTSTRPVSPNTGLPWDVVIRCDSSGGGGGPTENGPG